MKATPGSPIASLTAVDGTVTAFDSYKTVPEGLSCGFGVLTEIRLLSAERETTGAILGKRTRGKHGSGVVAVKIPDSNAVTGKVGPIMVRWSDLHSGTAQDGWEALETAKRLGKSIQAVLADMVMPKMGGTVGHPSQEPAPAHHHRLYDWLPRTE